MTSSFLLCEEERRRKERRKNRSFPPASLQAHRHSCEESSDESAPGMFCGEQSLTRAGRSLLLFFAIKCTRPEAPCNFPSPKKKPGREVVGGTWLLCTSAANAKHSKLTRGTCSKRIRTRVPLFLQCSPGTEQFRRFVIRVASW